MDSDLFDVYEGLGDYILLSFYLLEELSDSILLLYYFELLLSSFPTLIIFPFKSNIQYFDLGKSY